MKIFKIKHEYELQPEAGWREKVFRVIYLSNTEAGKLFNIILLGVILLSAIIISLETIPQLSLQVIHILYDIEFVITVLFTIEYILRIVCVKNKWHYILSFNGIIDFLSIAPFYVGLFFPQTHYFVIIRLLRLLRVFRVFNLLHYMHEGRHIVTSIKKSARKIYIFLLFLAIFVTIMGAVMYVVEGGKGQFNSIPNCIYWAAVTITTVGYGDITPQTPMGKFLSLVIMLCGYSILAVTTIIVTLDFDRFRKNETKKHKLACERCGNEDNDVDARYCKQCGKRLLKGKSDSSTGFSLRKLFSKS